MLHRRRNARQDELLQVSYDTLVGRVRNHPDTGNIPLITDHVQGSKAVHRWGCSEVRRGAEFCAKYTPDQPAPSAYRMLHT